ncbi:MAG: fimbrial protein [Bacteroidales bacterium]
MKLYKLILFVMALFLSAACTDDINTTQSGPEEGHPSVVTFSLSTSSNQTMTRAVASDADEKRVHNLYVLVFDQNGSRTSGQFFDRDELGDNKMQLLTKSGKKHIYGIANIDLGMTAIDAIKSDVAMLDAVNTEAELLEINSQLVQKTFARGDNFLMSGWIGDAAGNISYVDVQPGASSVGAIKLNRVDSKISFHVSTLAGVTFTPRDWRIVNVPAKVSLFSREASDRFTGEDDYFTTNWNNFEGEGAQVGKTFAFYLLENKHQYRKAIPDAEGAIALTPAQRYAYREKQEKNTPNPSDNLKPGQSVVNGAFVYAPEKGTYVQMRGLVNYKNQSDQDVVADVVYTIHLGYAKKDGISDPNDYNALRNAQYIYQVKIESAENIILEVSNNQENQPGAEGTVIVEGTTYNFDAHYETKTVSFSADMIGDNLDWYVHTPFSEGFSADRPKDKDWVLFQINTATQSGSKYSYSNSFQKFAGEANRFTGTTLAQFLNNKTKLLTVDQLVPILKECKAHYAKNGALFTSNLFDRNNKIVFTAFVNENYYTVNPEDAADNGVDLWKRFVNQPERILNILSENTYSADGMSMKTKAVISFRQASIQTMYNCDLAADQLKTAWGTEMIQDNNTYSFGTHSKTNCDDTRNGLTNTIALWDISSRSRWSTYIATATNELTTNYRKAMYACMRQNRDENGDNVIDKNEVKWYLAAIDQLTDIWIGENAFDLEARLYKKTTWQEQWYVSSTLVSNSNPRVLWSSEGSSIGNNNDSWLDNTKLYYRCVRNLGKGDGDTSAPEDFASYNSGTRTISLDKLSYKAIRSYSTPNELILHHERSADNKPYWSFEVASGYTGKGKNNAELNWDDINNRVNTRICPEGWHIPNQREMALIQSRVGTNTTWGPSRDHFASSAFSFNPADGDRYGFSIVDNAERIYMLTGKGSGYVKCVRDIAK